MHEFWNFTYPTALFKIYTMTGSRITLRKTAIKIPTHFLIFAG